MLTLLLALSLQVPQLPQKQLVAELTIPSSGDGWEFSAVAGVVEAPGGLYVSDWRTPAIHRFDRAGRHVAQLGRAGDGPGEYRMPIVITTRGDSLWLWEPGQSRATMWDGEGKVVRTTTLVGGDRDYGSAVLLSTGKIAKIPNWTSAREATGDAEANIQTFGADGRLDRTLLTIPVDAAILKIETGPQMFIMGQQPFTDGPLFTGANNGDGFVRVDRRTTGRAEFTVTRIDAEGRTRWHRSFPYTAGPIDPSVVDSVFRGYTAPSDPRATKIPEAKVREAIVVPPRAVPVLAAMVAHDGRVWLQRPVPAGRPARYTVLSATGAPEFEVTLPPRSRYASATANTLWVVTKDEDDLPSVVRYRIQ